jgi:plastocyanin
MAATFDVIVPVPLVFDPDVVNIAVNDTVRWTITDITALHNVTNIGGCPYPGFGSPPAMMYFQQYSYTFSTAGVCNYVCTIHAGMAGTVNVGQGTTTTVRPITTTTVIATTTTRPITTTTVRATTTTRPTTTTVRATTTTRPTTTTTTVPDLQDVGIREIRAPKEIVASKTKRMSVEVKLKNNSGTTQTRSLSLTLDGKPISGSPVSVLLSKLQEKTVKFNVKFSESGTKLLRASLSFADANPVNDNETVTVRVKDNSAQRNNNNDNNDRDRNDGRDNNDRDRNDGRDNDDRGRNDGWDGGGRNR